MKELELFYNDLRARKTNPEITIKNYDWEIREFFDILEIKTIDDINNLKIQDIDYYKSTLLSNKNQLSTIRTKLCAIRSFFEFLSDRDYITKNIITKNVYPTVVRKNKKIPSNIGFKNIVKLSEYNEKYYTLINLFISTGMRFSELASLKINDINGDTITIKGKGSKERTIILQENMIKLLNDYINNYRKNIEPISESEFYDYIDSNVLRYKKIGTYENYLSKMNECKDLIFQSETGFKLSNYNFNNHLKNIAKKAGINTKEKDMSAHILRHFYAIFNLENGVPLDVIQENMGHKNINTTRIYAETSLQRRREESKKACWVW